jgi:GTP-binding protein
VPGYGYAKVSRTQRAVWGKFIEQYLLTREVLQRVLLIIDLRHPPTRDDQAMYEWLKHNGLPVCVVATKADKLPKSKWPKHLKIVKETLGVEKGDPVVLFSAETGMGAEELWSRIEEAVGFTDQAVSAPGESQSE